MEHSGNIPIFSMPGTFFGNIPRNFRGNFFRILLDEYYTNIYLLGGMYTGVGVLLMQFQ